MVLATARVMEGVLCSSKRWLRVLETVFLDLARGASGSGGGGGGAREVVNVVVEENEEEIKMEGKYDDEEEVREVWMVLLFCATLVMVWSESDEVQLHW